MHVATISSIGETRDACPTGGREVVSISKTKGVWPGLIVWGQASRMFCAVVTRRQA